MCGIRNIYHCGSMEFPAIAIDANREASAIMTWIMIDNTSKASCGLNRNPALRIDKYPLCPVYILVFSQQIIFWMPFSSFWMQFNSFLMLHSFPLFLKLLTYLVDFKLTPADLLPVDSNTSPLCHGRLGTRIVICIFIFKFCLHFLNSVDHCL